MMDRPGKKWQCAAAIGLVLLTGAVLYAAIARPLIEKRQFYRDHIQSMQANLGRLEALVATRPELESRLAALQQDQGSKGAYLRETTPALAATGLRRRVKEIVQSSGGKLVSTQNLPMKEGQRFERVTLKVQMTGSTEALQQVLHGLESQRPYLFVDDLSVRAREIRRRRPRTRRDRRRRAKPRPPAVKETRLTVTFQLYGYLWANHGSG